MAQEQQYLTFGVDREVFGIEVENVQEILDLRPIARLPRAPPYLLGLMDVRGSGIAIIDLRLRLGLEARAAGEHTRVIIVKTPASDGQRHIGFVADRVFEVTGLTGSDLASPPTVGRRWRSECVSGIGRRGDDFVIVLRLDELLDADSLLMECA